MALITKIRNNTPLLIILIGGGMVAFLLMDMLGSSSGVLGNQNTVGSINGTKVTVQEFEEQMSFNSNSQEDVTVQRQNLWDRMVLKSIITKSSEKLGLGVGETEMTDLLTAGTANASPLLRSTFGNQQTGQIDNETLNYFKTGSEQGTLEPGQQQFWDRFQDDVRLERNASKITNLVTKSVYTPSWMIKADNKSQKVTFRYVHIPFDNAAASVPVKVSDDDLKAYLNKNQAKYTQDEATRSIKYVSFNVMPTAEDSSNLRDKMDEIASSFQTTTNDSSFLTQNLGVYDPAYYLKTEMGGLSLADQFFTAEPGTVFGPIIENNRYMVAKLMDRKVIPDSVRARHILIAVQSPDVNIQGVNAAKVRIDSFMQAINAGESFDSLAVRFSDDGGSAALGGDLGYFARNRMVKEFNDVCFYSGEAGKMYSVVSQIGVHLIKIEDKKGGTEEAVKAGIISKPIIPSANTQDQRYRDAYAFAGNNRTLKSILEAVAKDDNLKLEEAYNLGVNDYEVDGLEAGESARKIVRWAYNANEGDVSADIYTFNDPVQYFKSKYVVAAVAGKSPAGPMNVEAARSQILPLVENQKRADAIKGIASGKELQDVAVDYDAEVLTAENVDLNSAFIPGLGREPKVVAAALGLNINGTSAPIVGNNGIYIVETTYKAPEADLTNVSTLKESANRSTRTTLSENLLESMKKMAKVKDNRNTFF